MSNNNTFIKIILFFSKKNINFAGTKKSNAMKRKVLEELYKWKEQKQHKPLIIRGARQTGKTWLMREFGKQKFAETVYINFENEPGLKYLFKQDYNTTRIITTIELYNGKKIDPANTLLIFDEIQSAEGGITSLKYFCEDAPQYYIIAAGSLLGITLHQHTSFPVGKVTFLDLQPLTFSEFLIANGKELLLEAMQEQKWETISTFHLELINLLKTYFFVGGMPEVVQKWIDTNDFFEVRNTQYDILRSYQADFSKHAPKEQIPRLNMVWDSLPAQLSKENKKFIYWIIREGARAKDFELAIMWLINCGLVSKSNRISTPHLPLKAYQDMQVFKLYMVDVGLLGALSGLDTKTIIDNQSIFTEFKGAMTEQFIMQELLPLKNEYIGYWTNERSTAEVDFVIQKKGNIIPIEVKAGENLKSKSFTLFCNKYQPSIAIKTSLLPYNSSDNTIKNIPLYGLSCFINNYE